MPPSRTTVRQGFTLVELLIVVALIGIVGAVSVSTYVGWRADTHNREVVTQIERSLAQARQDAKRLSADVSVTFGDGDAEYLVDGTAVPLPGGGTVSTPSPSGLAITFSGVLGVQQPFQTVEFDVTTGTGLFERTATVAVIPPLGKTAVVQ